MSTGRCLCGDIRLETSASPAWVAYCHCASCRRHTASPVACFVNMPLTAVRFSGERARYVSTPGVTPCSGCPGVLECSLRKLRNSDIGKS